MIAVHGYFSPTDCEMVDQGHLQHKVFASADAKKKKKGVNECKAVQSVFLVKSWQVDHPKTLKGALLLLHAGLLLLKDRESRKVYIWYWTVAYAFSRLLETKALLITNFIVCALRTGQLCDLHQNSYLLPLLCTDKPPPTLTSCRLLPWRILLLVWS